MIILYKSCLAIFSPPFLFCKEIQVYDISMFLFVLNNFYTSLQIFIKSCVNVMPLEVT